MIYQLTESFFECKISLKKSEKNPNYLLDWFTKEDAIQYPEIALILTS